MKGLEIKKNAIAIIGFGVSGKSVARYFLDKNIRTDVFEDKSSSEFDQTQIQDFILNKNFSIYFSDYQNTIDITQYDYVIVSPGVHNDHKIILLAQEHGIEFITDINTFSRIFRQQYPEGKIISVTGSNGKSTTVSLLYTVLKAANLDVYLGGNIGTSPLDFLNIIKTDKPVIVLESSSYQLEYMKAQDYFDIACVLNISDNHLDRYHGKKSEYAKAKLGGINKDKTQAVVNFDDEDSKKYVLPNLTAQTVIGVDFEHLKNSQVITLENKALSYVEGSTKIQYLDDVTKLKIKGLHNIYNSAFVCGVLKLLEIEPNEKITQAFYSFSGLEHRIQYVATIDGVEYVNDSKSTSPDATIKALEALGKSKNIVLISGGVDKDIEYTSMSEMWGEHVKSVILLPGNAKDKLKKLAEDTEIEVLAEDVSMKDAVELAQKIAISGDTVLLSPSTASFASFKSFEDRGNQFIDCVTNLKV